MNLLFWGLTISMIGKVLLAAGVIIAHTELAHEKRIDQEVIKSFRVEFILTITGLLLIIGGYFMEIYFYGFTTTLLTCFGPDCGSAAAAAAVQ
tara:strand:- start:32 stop:310 length:279 start_codon:yes stop_codon:yes gene_type:complete